MTSCNLKTKKKNVAVSLPLLEWTSQLPVMVWPSVLIIIVSFITSGQKSRKCQSSGKRLGCLLSAPFYFIFHGSSVSWLCSLPPKANLLSDVSVMCLRGDSQERACLPAPTHGFKRRTVGLTFHVLWVSSSFGASEPDTPDGMCYLLNRLRGV